MPIHKMNIHRTKADLYLNQGPRKSRFPLNVADRLTEIFINKVDSLLKISHILLFFLQNL